MTSAIDGHCAPGFEPVRDTFAQNFEATPVAELGAAFCVFKGEECVVDLWGGYADPERKRPWTPDTIVNVWSTTKGAVALCAALLADRGLLSYDQPVSSYWPEFGAAGKESITVGAVLSHRAGLPAFAKDVTLDDLFDWEKATSLLAAQAPFPEAYGAVCYHPVTFGFLVGELIRRVSGQTPAAFLTEHLSGPAGAGFFIGVPADWPGEVADLVPPPAAQAAEMAPAEVVVRALSNPPIQADIANSAEWRAAQIPAANGYASARGVARLYGCAANDGRFAGRQLISAGGIAELRRVVTEEPDLMLGMAPRWSRGLMVNPEGLFGPHPETVGHCGWGGSFGCADHGNRISIGYTMNRMGAQLYSDARATALADCVYRCLVSES